jgi:hypothetical protein
MIAAVFASCKKNTTDTPAPVDQKMQEVEFDINSILGSNDRALYSIPNCIDSIDGEINKYAQIIIENEAQVVDTFYAEVYYVDGLPYTKAIMLPVTDDDEDCDTYILKEFYVYDNNGTPGYEEVDRADDQLFKAAPLDGSEFWDFAENHVGQTFEVCAFYKTKVLIDVLCFVPNDYELFGFFWFEITEITVREMCFFGDFCLKDTYIYEGTEYAESGGGVFIDEPAIFEIRARHKVGNGQWQDMVGTDFNNVQWLGVGEPLCIRYPDYDAEVDSYEFDLYLWAMVGNQMAWTYLYTFTWDDVFENTYDPGEDGVYEFVVGNCVATETDMLFPPYMNLPASGTMELAPNADPGTITGAYWDVRFGGFGAGYDILPNVWYPGWCGDVNTTIGSGTHNVTIFSTLDPVAIMPSPNTLSDLKLQQLNYLFNHYDTHGIDIYAPNFGPEFTTIQQSIWSVVHSPGGNAPYNPGNSYNPLAVTMATQALSNGAGFTPLPGGDAGILFFKDNGDGTYVAQLILIVVDP